MLGIFIHYGLITPHSNQMREKFIVIQNLTGKEIKVQSYYQNLKAREY